MSEEVADPELGRKTVDANLYMTLATADAHGRPWASPVWYAHDGYADFYWVSRPDARHSRNIASRSEISIVIFDSTVPVGGAKSVYLEAAAGEVAGGELEHGIEVFSRRSEATGAGEWRTSDVLTPAPHRLFRASASEYFVLVGDDRRIPVRLAGG